ncbi:MULTISPECIES: hypothetical protein [Thermotoga]|uniref:hypothetical protein n=1 Tax=Thermotoga TaxID=2335 RepID=UPI001D0FC628|nr:MULTISPECIES: hypothetical protein [Thermotoga]
MDVISNKTRRRIRNELLPFVGKRVSVRGKIKAFGTTRSPFSKKPTILITNVTVRYLDKKVKVDHLWVAIKRIPENMDIAVGDVVSFEADVVKYKLLPDFKTKDDILHPRYNYGVENPKSFKIIKRTAEPSMTLRDAFLRVL